MSNNATRTTKAVILDPLSSDERSANGGDALLAAGEAILDALLEGVHRSCPVPSVFDLARGEKGRALTVRI